MRKILLGTALFLSLFLPKTSKAQGIWPAAIGDSMSLEVQCTDSAGKIIACDSIWMYARRYTTSATPSLVDSGRVTSFPATSSTFRVYLWAGADKIYEIRLVGNIIIGRYVLSAVPWGGTYAGVKLNWPAQSAPYLVGAATTTNYAALADVQRYQTRVAGQTGAADTFPPVSIAVPVDSGMIARIGKRILGGGTQSLNGSDSLTRLQKVVTIAGENQAGATIPTVTTVTNGVTVTTNNDKTGYTLSAADKKIMADTMRKMIFGTDVLINGDFEEDDSTSATQVPTGWVAAPTGGRLDGDGIPIAPKHGRYMLDLNGGEINTKDSLYLGVGKRIHFGAWIWTDANSFTIAPKCQVIRGASTNFIDLMGDLANFPLRKWVWVDTTVSISTAGFYSAHLRGEGDAADTILFDALKLEINDWMPEKDTSTIRSNITTAQITASNIDATTSSRMPRSDTSTIRASITTAPITASNIDAAISSRMAKTDTSVLRANIVDQKIKVNAGGYVDSVRGSTNPINLSTTAFDTIAGGAATGLNLVSDPGFESRALGSNWKATGSANIVTNGTIKEGRKVLRLGQNGKVVGDTIFLGGNDRVLFGADVFFTNIASGDNVQLEDLAGIPLVSASSNQILQGNWQQVYGMYRGSGVACRLAFVAANVAGESMRVDNAFVIPILDTLLIGAGGGSTDTVAIDSLLRHRGYARVRFKNGVFTNDTVNALSSQAVFPGSNVDTVYTFNTTTGAVIPNILILVKTLAGAEIGRITTGITGKVAVNFQTTTHLLYPYFTNGIVWAAADNPDTFVVSAGGQVDTIKGSTTSFPAPPTGGQITVAGNTFDLLGDSIAGATVEFTLNQDCLFSTADTTNMSLVSKVSRARQTGPSGQWSIPLYPTSKMWGTNRSKGVFYSIKIYWPDGVTTTETSAQITFGDTPSTQTFQYKNYRPWTTK